MAEMTGIVKSNNEDLVLGFLRENFSLSVTRDEFNKIDARLFCIILSKFLEDFGIENYHQLDLMAVQGVSDIENYEETTQVINLWRAVYELLFPFGFNDFTLGDILQPRKQKALKVIIHLIRLWDKFTFAYNEWVKMEEDCSDIPERKRQIEGGNRELQSTLEERSCLLAKLRNENNSLEEKLILANEEQSKVIATGNSLNEESRALKLQIVTKKEELSDLTLQITRLKQEIQEAQSQVVHSPDKIIAETENKEKQLEDIRLEKLNLDKEYTVTSQNVQNLEVALKQSTAAMDILSQTAADVEKLKDEIRQIENIRSNLTVKEQHLTELSAVCQKNTLNIEQILKQKGIANIQQTQRLKPTKELNDNLKDKLNELLETESKLLVQYNEQEQQISQQFEEKATDHENFSKQLTTSKETIFAKMREYSQRIKAVKDGVSHKYTS